VVDTVEDFRDDLFVAGFLFFAVFLADRPGFFFIVKLGYLVLPFFCGNSAMRAFTSRLTRPDRSGLASGNRTVPFEVSYPSSSAEWARFTAAVIGYRLLWFFHAAYQTSIRPLSLKAGIP
jgi:hypothetical protein